jgi:uncharacterized lipoprotein
MIDNFATTVRAMFLACLLLLSACGGGKAVQSCDEHQLYKAAVDHKRVQAPDGLSQLDPVKEMPLPEASPQQARPAGSRCLDLPPGQFASDDEDEREEQLEEAAEPDPGAEQPEASPRVGEEYEPPTN